MQQNNYLASIDDKNKMPEWFLTNLKTQYAQKVKNLYQ